MPPRLPSLVAAVAVVLAGCVSPTAPELPILPGLDVLESRLTPEGVRASEASIAASPVDARVLVAAANSGGGFGVYRTADGGESWDADGFTAGRVDPAPGGAGRFRSLSDPVVAFGPDGTVYLAGLAYIPTSAVFVAVSRDGGATWPDVHVVHESDLATSFNDKEWIAVSPATGTIVAAWQKEPAMDQLRGVEERGGPDVDFGDVVVSRSTDGGASWSAPAVVSAGRHNNGTQVAFTPEGRVHLLWVNYESVTLDYSVSEDDGASWSAPRAIVPIDFPEALPRYARMHTLPALAASPTGALYAVWHDERDGDPDVYAVASADSGASWSSATRVNDDAAASGARQMYPWAAVGPDGRLHVTFYDDREDAQTPRFRYAMATADGPDLRFGPTHMLSSEPFTAFAKADRAPTEPDDEARGLGDYTGVVATERGVVAAWADGRGDFEQVWAARVAFG